MLSNKKSHAPLLFFMTRRMRIFMDKKKQMQIAAMRVRKFRKSLGMNQSDFADFIGVEGENGQSTVSKWEAGKQIPSTEYAAKMAIKAQVDPVYFSGLEVAREIGASNTRKYTVVGELRAGQWRESVEWSPDDQYEVALPFETGVPPYVMKAFIIRGDSMDQFYPDGSIVYVAGLIENRLAPENGDHVLVQRRDKFGMYESTLKELVVGPDGRNWLMPRSSNPEFQAPIEVGTIAEDVHEDSEEVRITGIVQAAFVKPQRKRLM